MSIDQTYVHEIVAVVKDKKGEITAYKLENGEIIQKEQAVIMAKEAAIKGVTVGKSKAGEEFLRGMPDGETLNNLSNLPVVEG